MKDWRIMLNPLGKGFKGKNGEGGKGDGQRDAATTQGFIDSLESLSMGLNY